MSDDAETLPQPPVREGEILAGKYRVEHVLGVGGMGVVVAARHLELDQPVALKFLLPVALSKAVVVERFAREARAAVRLKSEHVARVIDVGKLPGGEPYMVMELLDGVDLATLLETSGPLAPADAVDYVLQACEAVAEAHALGIIHRDLKPRNLFLTKRVDGRPLVKVLDFGISKVADAPSQPKLSLTRTSEVMGSPMYMSPEQLRSARDVDERTDIWALGVIIYELLTGAVPFEAETVTQLCAMVLQDQPRPLQQIRPDVPPGLAAVVARCLEKNSAARFDSIADLADALDEFTLPDSRGAARRIRRVTDESAPRSLGVASMRGPVSQRVSVSGGTSVSWGETEYAGLPHKRSTRARWIPIGAGAAGVLTIGVLAVLLARSGSHPATQPEPTSSVATVAPKASDPNGAMTTNGLPLTPPTTSVTAIAPSASAATTSLKPGMSPIAATTKPTASAAPLASATTKPTATAAPTTTAGGNRPKDDMPSDRH